MNKSTITKAAVFKIADNLAKQDKYVTQAAVREILQCGSNTTIHKYLKAWREAKIVHQALLLPGKSSVQSLKAADSAFLDKALQEQEAINKNLQVHYCLKNSKMYKD